MAAGAAWRIALPRQTISRLYGLNFDCATSSDTFNCTNNFLDPYLPIHNTNFYGAAICIKAVYSQNSQCKAFLGPNLSQFCKF